ncbi:MAG TPA: DinB family protein [Bacillus sp. (in: firmicutes)]|uniref:DinB family protein n=1 Tax=Bacillus litorisediminis TaxID=2922713 RepID=UPI001FADE3D3|nr:DinB family protein [Bacillus litorisediminis]HWO75172.1 DinB family protein [Bacillus sp. (in: firmicutes)]
MKPYIFRQLQFVRNQTLKELADVDDQSSEIIPAGSNNHIKWNAGHICLVQEKFAFFHAGEPMQIPEDYKELFSPGTKPNQDEKYPPMREIIHLLENQMERIEQVLQYRLDEEVSSPYTTSKGMYLSRVDEFLSFCLYHEGMHFEKIKMIKKLI